MSRDLRKVGAPRAPRKRAAYGPMIAAVAACAAVFGVVALAMNRTPAPSSANRNEASSARVDASSSGETTAANRADAAAPRLASRDALRSSGSAVAGTAPVRPAAVKTAPLTAAQAVPVPADRMAAVDSPEARARLVADQIAAGEFGPALETAQRAGNAAERTALLQSVADAQARGGDFRAADRSISRIPVPETRARAHAENSVRESAAGGGADATKLVNLIKTVTGTDEDWDDERRKPTFWVPGVMVDPNGQLRTLTREEKRTDLSKQGHAAREADLNTDMKARSALRLVSLTRLEKEAARRLAEGRDVPETMQHMAGLSHIQYVFVYPEEHEIVIGGPAEGWRYNESGLAVGVTGNRPTLYLDDLVTVLRTFSPRGAGFFNCLIVPREDGLRAIKQFVEESNAKGPLNPQSVRSWTAKLQQKLGLQDVEVNGIPLDSRVAQVIVEADYRMKLIGVGKLDGGSEIPSYFDLLPKTGSVTSQNMDALRWWLSLKYDSVLHSPDRNVFEIRGSAVLCQSENELITAQGQRIHTGQAEATNRLFAANFTTHYRQLAARDLVFADLQNIFDLSLVAALLTDNRIPDQIGWNLGAFGPEGAYRTARYQAPKTVMSVVNHRVYNGKDIVVQVAGGVEAKLQKILADPHIVREAAQLAGVGKPNRADEQLPAGRWWWDAKAN